MILFPKHDENIDTAHKPKGGIKGYLRSLVKKFHNMYKGHERLTMLIYCLTPNVNTYDKEAQHIAYKTENKPYMFPELIQNSET